MLIDAVVELYNQGSSTRRMPLKGFTQGTKLVAFLLGAVLITSLLLVPMFPRRVLITPTIALIAPVATLIVVTLASLLGVAHVMRIDPARALEG